jgi:hypothetical protein
VSGGGRDGGRRREKPKPATSAQETCEHAGQAEVVLAVLLLINLEFELGLLKKVIILCIPTHISDRREYMNIFS